MSIVIKQPSVPRPPAFDRLMERMSDLQKAHRAKVDVEVMRMLDLWDHKRDGKPTLVWRRYGDIVDAGLLGTKDREEHAEFADKLLLCGLASEDFPEHVIVPVIGVWTAAPIVKLVGGEEYRR